jgi:nucleoside-diphosphate-sugar epimerase
MKKTICVAGASGLVGSNIVKTALSRGYHVNGTMRDKDVVEKTKYLNALKNSENLTLYNADMHNSASFDAAITGTDAVFITCLIPTYKGPSGQLAKEMNYDQGYNDIIKPTLDGCMNIMKSAHQKNLKNIVICSSTSSTNPFPPVSLKNELDHWSDETEQCKAKKFTSAAKTVMEKAAIKFAAMNNIRLSIILPTGLYGEAILPEHLAHNPFAWLKNVIDGNSPRHQKTPNDSTSMIHLEDLANLFLAAYENPNSTGRYFGVYDSLHWQDIYAECKKLLPLMQMPDPISEDAVQPTNFDLTRRNSLGVNIRDFPTLLQQTIQWIKSDPFTTTN